MPEIGIIIKAISTGVEGTLKGIGTVAKKSLGTVRAVADKAKASFETFGKAAEGLNAALEIGRKAWGALQMVVGGTVTKALEFRKAGDPVLKWFSDMKRDTDLLVASIGDMFIPVLQGLAEGFGLVGRGASDWVRENRRLMASKLLEWIMNIGNFLIKSVAKGALLVVKVWKGWEQAINLVKSVGETMFAAILGGVDKTIVGMSRVVRVFDQDLADSMVSAANSVAALATEFEQAAEKSTDAIFKSNAEMVALEKQINKVEKVALVKLAKAGEIAQDKIQKSVAGTTKNLEEQKGALEKNADAAIKSAERVDAFLESRHQARLRRLELEESISTAMAENEASMAETTKAKTEEAVDSLASKIETVYGWMQGALDTFVAETERANEMMADAQQAAAEGAVDATEKMNAAREAQGAIAGKVAKQTAISVIDSVPAQVAALAVQAAAGAFAGMTTIPVIGVALGIAAAAVAGAAVMAMGAGLKGLVSNLEKGGVIKGGVAGRDSVPAMLMPGEQVMSVPERQAMQLFMGRLLGAQAGQSAVGLPATQPGGGQSVVLNQKTEIRTWVPNIVEETKMARRMERGARRRLQQQEMLLSQGAA